MDAVQTIRAKFAESISGKDDSVESFEYGLSEVSMLINQAAPNAANFQMLFDLMYWDWTKDRSRINPNELDRICLKYSRFGESQEAEIKDQVKSAQEWANALKENGISPAQALGLAKAECVMIVEKEQRSSAIAAHPSHLAVPQEITRLMRQFYRADKMYNPSTTNVLKPLYLAKEVISKSDSASTGEELKQLVVGRLSAFMRQVRNNTALGRWVVPDNRLEIHAICEFADFIVFNLLEQRWNGSKAQFSSKNGIGLIEDAVYFLYILEQEKENNSKAG